MSVSELAVNYAAPILHDDGIPITLLEWLERFAERLKARTSAVADEVQQVVDEMEAVELNLQNTFNSFRSLSSSQFVENHVYEEDETDLVTTGMSKKDAKHSSMPTESYEDEILPRYKDAVALAWSAFQRGGRHDDQRSVQLGPRSKLRDSHRDERIEILPHILGSEEFNRDVHCGLADLRPQHLDPESDTDVDRGAASLLAESTGTRILSEGEISGTDSDAFDYQEESLEPAVSAALDFKAMLEAALRNPSLPYDGGTPNDSSFGEFAGNKFSLPNLTDDYLNDTPRNISTMVDIIGRTMSTMDESKDELRASASQQSNANVGSTKTPLATEPPQVLDDPSPSSTPEELLNYSITQSLLNQEFKQYINSNTGSKQVGSGDLGHVSVIPGGLVSDETHDSASLTKGHAIVPNSNTEPTIPQGLFQEKLVPEPVQHKRTNSQSSNSLDSSENPPLPLASLVDVVSRSTKQDPDSVPTKSKNNGSEVASSVTPKHANLQSVRASISAGSDVVFGSQQADLLPWRGGLFDDDEDEEDEDGGGLFGAPAPRANRQPVVRPWASQSNKGLFDDVAADRDGTTLLSDEAGSSKEAPHKADFLSLISSEYRSKSGEGALDPSKQQIDNASSVQTYSESIDADIVKPSGPKETVSNYPSDVKEDIQPSIQSTVAAALKSSVPFIAESDDDSWSGSESGVEDSIQGRNVVEQSIHQDTSMIAPQNNGSGETSCERSTAGVVLNLGPEVPVDSGNVAESLSDAEEILTGVVDGEGETAVVSSQTVPEEPPARTPLAASRSSSSTETLLKVPVQLPNNPLLQSEALEFSDGEASDLSDSATTSGRLQGIGQRQAVQNVLPGSSAIENLGPLTIQPTSAMSETKDSSVQNSGRSRTSENWGKVSIPTLPVPAKDLGRSTTRTFTLFEDDDGEEDLFGPGSPQHQGALFPRSEEVDSVLSSDATVRTTEGEGRVVEPESLVTTLDTHTQLPLESNLSSNTSALSHPIIAENKDGDRSSTKSGSKLSSLLFGDDDEDDEDALFGPLGGRRSSRGLKSGTVGSIFGDPSLPSTSSGYPPKKGKGLFDD